MLVRGMVRGVFWVSVLALAFTVVGCPEPATVLVPDVVGMSRTSAGVTLAANGLVVGVVTEQSSDSLPEGTVISTNPAAGTSVAQGSAVDLVVVAGDASVSIPNVVGLTQAAAASALASAGLTTGVVSQQYSSSVPTGRVILQSPAAGSLVSPGSAVNLAISKGPAPVAVPNVVGQSESGATSAIVAVSLAVGVVSEESSDTVPAGCVISQSPAAGVQVASGSAVDLVVSRGAPSCTVPNVTGLTQSVAESLLSLMKLNVGSVSEEFNDTVAVGRVLSQNPAEGTRVMAGDAVDLVLSKGVAPVTVPDVTGLSCAAAETALVSAGLVLGSTTEQHSERVPEGNVISQFPAAGTSVALGAAVNLAVSGGSAPVTVPNIGGLTQSAAEYALTFAGLVLGSVGEEFSDTVALGRVVTQDPAKGASVDAGSPVNVSLSKGPAPVAVPGVVGMALPEAETAITTARLRVGTVTQQYSETVPQNQVVSQNPEEGTSVPPEAPVDLIVSKGPVKSDLVVDTTSILLTSLSPAVVVQVSNTGEGTLAWTATPSAESIAVNPTDYTGNAKEVTIGTSDFSTTYSGQVTFVNNERAADVEVISVTVVAAVADPVVPGAMVHISESTFEMGELEEVPWSPPALPIHSVRLSAYEIGKYEVTNREYADMLNWALAQGILDEDFADTGMSLHRKLVDFGEPGFRINYANGCFVVVNEGDLSMENHPVAGVSWYGAAAYCNWLSEANGLTPCYDTDTWAWDFSGGGYHLPTEAQWERAAAWGGGKHWDYGFMSDSIDASRCNYDLSNPLGLVSEPFTTPIGYYGGANGTVNSMSPVGCYDMAGNVAEWCNDWYDCDYYERSPLTDPGGAGHSLSRVVRGGDWSHGEAHCRTGLRLDAQPFVPDSLKGFRLAKGGGPAEAPACLFVDRCAVELGYGALSKTLCVENVGKGTLSWTAVSDDVDVVVSPSSGVGDATEVTVSLLDPHLCRGASVTFTNEDDASNFEVVEVRVAGPAPGEMVFVPSGAFEMGDPWGEGDSDELPLHTVTLSAYYIGKYPVTNRMYADALNWANANGYLDFSTPGYVKVDSHWAFRLDGAFCCISYESGQFVVPARDGRFVDDDPVQAVSWYGAVAYCDWLSEREGLEPCYDSRRYYKWESDLTKNGYHLPTEAQWERAAAWDGSRHWRYSFLSDSLNAQRCNYAQSNPLGLAEMPFSTPVGYFDGLNGTVDSPSPVGCYDMTGAVMEWCTDCYVEGGYPDTHVTDPVGSRKDMAEGVLRGGSWWAQGGFCRSASRKPCYPDMSFDTGFRLARAPARRVVVPNLIRCLEADAEWALVAAELSVGAVTEHYSESVPEGRVMSQSPAPEVAVAWGKAVEMVVSLGPYPVPEEPSSGEMRVVPAGSFMMGDPWEDEWGARETPVHVVTLSAYSIGEYEVTNQQFADALNWANYRGYLSEASPSTVAAHGQELFDVDGDYSQIVYSCGLFVVTDRDGLSMKKHPVVCVSWYGAAVYCNWLSECQGLEVCYDTDTWDCDFSKSGYHLLTEAQWERAAAWDGSRHVRYGNGLDSVSCANANFDECNPLELATEPYTTEVGSYGGVTSHVGCYDMCGNVWEWCNDRDYRVYTSDPVTDPEGPSVGGNRAVRGGCWVNGASACSSAHRLFTDPEGTERFLGFRVAR